MVGSENSHSLGARGEFAAWSGEHKCAGMKSCVRASASDFAQVLR